MSDNKSSVKNALNSSNAVTATPGVKAKTPEGRPARVPLTQQFKLTVPDGVKEDGYAYRYIKDKPDRVEVFEAAWWEPVKDGAGRPIRKVSGSDGYLLLYRIKQEYFDEDAAEKRKLPINLLTENAKLAKGNQYSKEYIPEGQEGVVVINN